MTLLDSTSACSTLGIPQQERSALTLVLKKKMDWHLPPLNLAASLSHWLTLLKWNKIGKQKSHPAEF
jgi:hypothetical protein